MVSPLKEWFSFGGRRNRVARLSSHGQGELLVSDQAVVNPRQGSLLVARRHDVQADMGMSFCVKRASGYSVGLSGR